MGNAVHRLVEQQAALRPDAVAVVDGGVDGGRALTYRELNGCANTLARRLKESGLTRGALAFVRLPRGADLAVVLLAVLKAGAAYAWVEPGSAEDIELPASFCVAGRGPRVHAAADAAEERYTAIDITGALAECARHSSANLPVLTRGTDVACVLPDGRGRPHVLVPHETIASLPQPAAHTGAAPLAAAGALDLWVGLMSGTTLTLAVDRPSSAAA